MSTTEGPVWATHGASWVVGALLRPDNQNGLESVMRYPHQHRGLLSRPLEVMGIHKTLSGSLLRISAAS